MDTARQYRRRTTMPVGRVSGRLTLGFGVISARGLAGPQAQSHSNPNVVGRLVHHVFVFGTTDRVQIVFVQRTRAGALSARHQRQNRGLAVRRRAAADRQRQGFDQMPIFASASCRRFDDAHLEQEQKLIIISIGSSGTDAFFRKSSKSQLQQRRKLTSCKHVAPMLMVKACDSGSNVTRCGAGMRSTLVMATVSCEESLSPSVLRAFTCERIQTGLEYIFNRVNTPGSISRKCELIIIIIIRSAVANYFAGSSTTRRFRFLRTPHPANHQSLSPSKSSLPPFVIIFFSVSSKKPFV